MAWTDNKVSMKQTFCVLLKQIAFFVHLVRINTSRCQVWFIQNWSVLSLNRNSYILMIWLDRAYIRSWIHLSSTYCGSVIVNRTLKYVICCTVVFCLTCYWTSCCRIRNCLRLINQNLFFLLMYQRWIRNMIWYSIDNVNIYIK